MESLCWPESVESKLVFTVVIYGCESWTIKKAGHCRMMLSNCNVGKDSWESLGLEGNQTSQSNLNIDWKDWCWSWSSNTSVTWCEEPSGRAAKLPWGGFSVLPKRLWIAHVCLFSGLSVSLKNKDYKISNLSFLRINWQYR